MKKLIATALLLTLMVSNVSAIEGASGSKTDSIDLPFVGEVEPENHSIVLLTGMVAFIDGFNPCSLWVLTFLLGLVVHSGSRKKTAAVGLTFLTVTTIGYGAFIYGLINVFSYVSHLNWIKGLVALVAFIFGIVNVKDFFWFNRGISFTIPGRIKPKIAEKLTKTVRKDSLMFTLLGTAIIAAGIVLVELPCTAGFPLIYSNILADRGIAGGVAVVLLGLYMLVYLLDELAVFLGITYTMEKTRFKEKHGRYLKLLGGNIMIALGVTLLWKQELMESLVGTIYVFGSATII